MSNTKSYQEKIRERFLNKKRQASITSRSPFHADNCIQKLNLDYLKEESEVQNALENRKNKPDISISLNKEVEFFTDTIYDTNFDNIKENNSEESIHSTKSDINPDPESPTHLASSYLHVENLSVVEKYSSTKIVFDNENLLYFPKWTGLEMKTITDDDESVRNLEDEGLYVPPEPNFTKRNKILMCNRFSEESNIDWLNSDGNFVKCQMFSGDKLKQLKFERFIPTFIEPIDFRNNIPYILENKIIKIHIKKMLFNHHPLFCHENIITKRLENLYEQYMKRNEMNIIDKIESKLTVLRQLVSDIEKIDEAETAQQASKVENNLTILKKYKCEIRDLRNNLHREEKTDCVLVKTILSEWKKLKTLRSNQNYNVTSIKLVIRKEDVNLNENQKIWNERFELELNEILDEAFQFYYDEKKKLKADIDNEKDDLQIIKRPIKPNPDDIKNQLNDIFLKSVRRPGDPKLIFELKNIDLLKQKENTKELKRLNEIANTKYFVKLIFDNIIVSSPKEIKLSENFDVFFDASFTVKLTTNIPDKITLKIYEKTKIGICTKISSIYLPMPDEYEHFKDVEYHNYEFSSEKSKSSIAGVGSGSNYKSDNGKIIYTSGTIIAKIGWNHLLDKNVIDEKLVGTIKQYDNLERIENKLKMWFDNHLIDPMDPETKFLMTVIDATKKEKILHNEKINGFQLNEDLLTFCSANELDKNVRLNMLSARYRKELKYKDMKLIPQLEREIEFPEENKIIEETIGMDPIDLQRHNGKKYLQQVYETITNHSKLISKNTEEHNILIGDENPTISSLSLAFLQIIGPKRPLKPIRKTQNSRNSCRLIDIQNFHVIVNIERAFGVPIRGEDQYVTTRKNSTLSSAQQSFKTVNVRPFVNIFYKDKTARTSTAEGSSPTWNEQLSLMINNKLNKTKGSLSIQLFDEFVEDLLEDDRYRTTEIYHRISSKWLGELRIPISTIYSNQRIEGIFEMITPSVLLGYGKPTLGGSSEYHSSVFIGSLPDIRSPMYLSLIISVEPVIQFDNVNMIGLECTELGQMKLFIDLWYNQLKIEFPLRAQNPLVTLLNGKRVCITRLLGPVLSPFESNDDAEFLIRRFTSLIPNYQIFDHCISLDGVWLTNNQILNLMSASVKDLGVLLTCFYIGLGFRAWLIFGHSLRNGNTCFVLLKESNEFFIVDPSTGKKYNSNDTYCPLTKVYCVVNEFNVWSNIQREDRVYMTQFDVSKSGDWRSLFTKSFEASSGIIHDSNYIYRKSYDFQNLQKVIELKIIKKITSWRTNHKTIWNRYMNENLKLILKELEKEVCFEYEDSESHSEKLTSMFSSYKINGFPINIPYISLSSIVDRVKSTGLHLNTDNKVEFALAVDLFDYSCNVFSVWIFLVALIPKG